jgi:(2Fe-2S) ferredoxin
MMLLCSILCVVFACISYSSALVVTPHVFVCTSKTCKKANSHVTFELFRDLAASGVVVEESGCHGKCGEGPNVRVSPSGNLYTGVYKPSTAAKVLSDECGAPVPAAALTAYKHKMYGDQELREGQYAKALQRLETALSSNDLSDHPTALSSVWLSKAEALHKLALTSGRREGLADAEAAARQALAAQSSNKAAWLRLCDVLDAQGMVSEAVAVLADMQAAVPATAAISSVLTKKLERLQGKLAMQ